jgi:methionyl-tRNA synthetase
MMNMAHTQSGLQSPNKKRKILITCALPYANGSVHVGHMLEHIEADIYSRFLKMAGHECIFICADDTHGTPIMIAAQKANVTPEKFIEKYYLEHTRDFKKFNIGFDHYGSTNSEENKKLCELFYSRMKEQNHVHKKSIDQLFCSHDKMFLPDRFVKGTCPKCKSPDQYGDNCDICAATYSPQDLINPGCSICGTKPILKPSDHIFFKLNHFKTYLKNWLPDHTANETAKKMLEWFDEDLRDWDISRDAPYFGIEIPGEAQPDGSGKKYFYVWVDAPMGYISTTEQFLKKNNRELSEFWGLDSQAEIYHFIGKDIVYFHTLFWPALLQSAQFKSPTRVNVHGHVMVNGEKMSKSKGTSITAEVYAEFLEPEYLRYYYATKLNATVDDLDLNFQDFTNRINSDLVGKIVNLASRGAQMLNKNFNSQTSTCDDQGKSLIESIQAAEPKLYDYYNRRELTKVTTLIREFAEMTNKYFDEKAPWKTVTSLPNETQQVVTTTLNCFRLMAIYLSPIMPDLSQKVSDLFFEKKYQWTDLNRIIENSKINNYVHLAQRVDPLQIQNMIEKQKSFYQEPAKKTAPAAKTENATPLTEIDFEDFAKVELKIGEIIEAEEIKEADKLLRLKIDIGQGVTKQIIAGIKSAYSADQVKGRKVLVCTNLKPRKMKFGISEGMVLAAGDGGSDLFLLSPDSGAKTGSKVK